MSIIWFVVTLPLPWMITGDVGQNQLGTLLPIIGFLLTTFVMFTSKIRIDIKGKWTERYYMDPSWRSLFSEEFILKGTPVDTGISKYYTWEYVGQKYVYIPEVEEEANYEITIIRTGNLKGSVTISLLQ